MLGKILHLGKNVERFSQHTVPLKSELPVASLGHRALRESSPPLQESSSARRKPRSRRRDSRLARGW